MNIKQIIENINLEKIMYVISLNEISGNENVMQMESQGIALGEANLM